MVHAQNPFVLLGDLPSDRQAPFDRAALTGRLRSLGVRMLPAADEPDVFRFEDNNRIVVELRVAG